MLPIPENLLEGKKWCLSSFEVILGCLINFMAQLFFMAISCILLPLSKINVEDFHRFPQYGEGIVNKVENTFNGASAR